MKAYQYLILSFGAFALSQQAAIAAPPSQQPVYIFVTADISDHINLNMTEERLRRILPMVDRYRKAHPSANLKATILFSGAVSQALAERNKETHILDFVLDFIHRGVIEAGYDGFAEPTYVKRPLVELGKAKTREERWQERAGAAEKFLTEARDPVTGDVLPGQSGGLKKMQEVFGEAAYINGLTLFGSDAMVKVIPEVGTDSETVQQLRRYNSNPIMAGLLDPGLIETTVYRSWAGNFSKEMSPLPSTPPELFWQDNVLRFSELAGPENRLVHASAATGVDALKTSLEKMDRSRIRFIQVQLGSDKDYLTPMYSRGEYYPPTRYAYNHPNQPTLPAEALVPAANVEKAYAAMDATLKWITEDVSTADSSVHFISTATLKRMIEPATGFTVSFSSLRPAVEQMLTAWGKNPTPPKYLMVQGHYLSRAEMFQVMSDALAQQNRSGKPPKSIRSVPVVAPIDIHEDKLATGEVSASSVARACSSFADRLHDATGTPVPHNIIPDRIAVEGAEVDSAQFLRLMAEALVAASPKDKLEIKPIRMFSGQDELYYKTRLVRDMGGLWTRKPAIVTTPRTEIAAR